MWGKYKVKIFGDNIFRQPSTHQKRKMKDDGRENNQDIPSNIVSALNDSRRCVENQDTKPSDETLKKQHESTSNGNQEKCDNVSSTSDCLGNQIDDEKKSHTGNDEKKSYAGNDDDDENTLGDNNEDTNHHTIKNHDKNNTISDALEHLKCCLCHEYVTDNRICPYCEQCFCKVHLLQWIESRKQELPNCPMCRKIIPNIDMCSHSQLIERVAQNIEQECQYKCGKWIKRSDLKQHYELFCPKMKIHCIHEGCDFFGERKIVKETHEGNCIYRHVKCECGELVVFKQLDQHKRNQCPVTMSCPKGCGEIIRRCDQNIHEERYCLECQCNCLHHEIGCKWKGLRKHLHDPHLNDSCMYEKLKAYLYEKHAENKLLKKKVNELESQVQLLNSQLSQVSKIMIKFISESQELKKEQQQVSSQVQQHSIHLTNHQQSIHQISKIMNDQISSLHDPHNQNLNNLSNTNSTPTHHLNLSGHNLSSPSLNSTTGSNASNSTLPMQSQSPSQSLTNLPQKLESSGKFLFGKVASFIRETVGDAPSKNSHIHSSKPVTSSFDEPNQALQVLSEISKMDPEKKSTNRQAVISHSNIAPSKPSLLKKENELIVSGGKDGSIKIWNVKTGKFVKSLTEGDEIGQNADGTSITEPAHTGPVWDLRLYQMKTDKKIVTLLCSCSNDQTIKLWNVKSGKCITTLNAHDASIRSLCVFKQFAEQNPSQESSENSKSGEFTLYGELLCSATVNGCIKVWQMKQNANSSTYSFVNVASIPKAHNASIYCLETVGNKYLCSASSELKIWTLDKGGMLHNVHTFSGVFKGPIHTLYHNHSSLQKDMDMILYSADTNCVKIWDLKQMTCVKELKTGHQSPIVAFAACHYHLKQHQWLLCTSSIDKTIKIWKMNHDSFDCIKTLRGHDGWVTSISSCYYDTTGTKEQVAEHPTNSTHTNLDPDQATKIVLVSSSQDKTLKVWDFNQVFQHAVDNTLDPITCEDLCLRTLQGNKDTILCIRNYPI